mgnify:CR=1 FL=1
MTTGWKTRDRIRSAVADAVAASVDLGHVGRVCALLLDPDASATEPVLRAVGPADWVLWTTRPLPSADAVVDRLAHWWEDLCGGPNVVSANLRVRAARLRKEDADAAERAQAERVRLAEKALREAEAALWRAERGIG